MKKQRKLKDYSGIKFNRLTAIKLIQQDTVWNNHTWEFRCDCGTLKNLSIKSVRSGKTSSCGCLKSELLSIKNQTHGLSKLYPLSYRTWKDMRRRCTAKTSQDYKDYGGRGISICNEWDDFATFFQDMGERLSTQTIERINVDGNYNKENCKWATIDEQALNRRSNRKIMFNGELKALAEIARETGIKRETIAYRLNKGYTVNEAISKNDFRK